MPDTNAANPEVARVSVKIPAFWRKNVKIWFLQVESQFITAQINNEITKYHYILGSLDSEVAELVSDFICKPLTKQPYTDLKTRLIHEFEESEERKAKKLLTEIELGDRKPSTVLREMRTLANNKVSDDFLRTMFMQRLPPHARSILATSHDDLDTIANMADKIMEINQPDSQYLCATKVNSNNTDPQSTSDDRLSRLEQHLAALTASIQELKINNRQRSKSRSPYRKKYDTCWYHYKFKEHAKKCIEPCNFKRSSENSQARH